MHLSENTLPTGAGLRTDIQAQGRQGQERRLLYPESLAGTLGASHGRHWGHPVSCTLSQPQATTLPWERPECRGHETCREGTRGWGGILAKCGFTGISNHFWNVALPVPVKHPVGLGIPSGTVAAT